MTTTARDKAGEAAGWWHDWVNDHKVAGLALVSVIATQMGTYFGYVFEVVGLPKLPWPLYNGVLSLALNDAGRGAFFTPDDAGALTFDPGTYFVGLSLHYVNGIVFGILFGVLLYHMIPLPYNHVGSILRGLFYGVIMTIISIGLITPYAYSPRSGYGLFSFSGPDGWKLPAGVLVWHLIYGLFLGLLYQPRKEQT